MAQQAAVDSLTAYCTVIKKVFSDETRYKDINMRKYDGIIEKLKVMAKAADPTEDSYIEVLKKTCGWVSFTATSKKLRDIIEVNDIYDGGFNREREDRDRNRDRDRSCRGKHGNAANLSDNTDYDPFDDDDLVARDRRKAARNKDKQMSGNSIWKECEYLPFCIRNLMDRELLYQEAVTNIMTRAIDKPFDPLRFKSIRYIKNWSDPLLTNVFMIAFFDNAKEKLKQSVDVRTAYASVESSLKDRIPHDKIKVSTCNVNKALAALLNSKVEIGELLDKYKQKLDLLSSNGSNTIQSSSHYPLPHEICWDNYVFQCAGDCGLPHICAESGCIQLNHKIFECPNVPIKKAIKSQMRASYLYQCRRASDASYSKRSRGGYKGGGRGGSHRQYHGAPYSYYNGQYPTYYNAPNQADNGNNAPNNANNRARRGR